MGPELAESLSRSLGSAVVAMTPVGGGDVASAYRVQLGDGRTVFAKTHDRAPPGFFATEASGLRSLAEVGAVKVPGVLAVGEEPPLLALEWIEQGPSRTDTDARFGTALAELHRAGAPRFGREDRRPTGSRSLPNDPAGTWVEFYADRRLRPLADLAEANAALGAASVDGLRRIADRLGDLGGPEEAPARLHGDLWAGNRIVGVDGSSWLVDPAAHGGHREFDLAMMRLFGGFGPAAFDAYQRAHPLADGWEDRVGLHQLAPLVVHAVKFSGGYVAAAEAAIRRYR